MSENGLRSYSSGIFEARAETSLIGCGAILTRTWVSALDRQVKHVSESVLAPWPSCLPRGMGQIHPPSTLSRSLQEKCARQEGCEGHLRANHSRHSPKTTINSGGSRSSS